MTIRYILVFWFITIFCGDSNIIEDMISDIDKTNNLCPSKLKNLINKIKDMKDHLVELEELNGKRIDEMKNSVNKKSNVNEKLEELGEKDSENKIKMVNKSEENKEVKKIDKIKDDDKIKNVEENIHSKLKKFTENANHIEIEKSKDIKETKNIDEIRNITKLKESSTDKNLKELEGKVDFKDIEVIKNLKELDKSQKSRNSLNIESLKKVKNTEENIKLEKFTDLKDQVESKKQKEIKDNNIEEDLVERKNSVNLKELTANKNLANIEKPVEIIENDSKNSKKFSDQESKNFAESAKENDANKNKSKEEKRKLIESNDSPELKNTEELKKNLRSKIKVRNDLENHLIPNNQNEDKTLIEKIPKLNKDQLKKIRKELLDAETFKHEFATIQGSVCILNIITRNLDIIKKSANNISIIGKIKGILVYKKDEDDYRDYWDKIKFKKTEENKYVDETGFFEGILCSSFEKIAEDGNITPIGFFQDKKLTRGQLGAQLTTIKILIDEIASEKKKNIRELMSENNDMSVVDKLIFAYAYRKIYNDEMKYKEDVRVCVCNDYFCSNPCKEIRWVHKKNLL